MVGCLASVERPDVFKKLILLAPSPRYLNDVGYYGGFDQKDLDQLYGDMKSNFKSWVTGFGPLAVGSDLESSAVQEFSRTFYSMRPDIALSVCKTIFQSDLRATVPLVTVSVHLLQTRNDMAVPFDVANYLLHNLGGWASMDVLNTEGHLPHLSHPNVADCWIGKPGVEV
ncbi:hypothetical protein KC19_VG041700 [Ceratodon purpureus]|uniref:Uncharacterized protein n=1 Tax=Ceratodon purpureus TaxID=3225 RepID=A0A8T0HLQ3_CERPU|nr:hypothetical protein KC19_VG041700 [Ceratodon purpureus]